MGLTSFYINLRIIASFFRLMISSVSAFAKIMGHGIMVDPFEDEIMLNCLHQVLRINLSQ